VTWRLLAGALFAGLLAFFVWLAYDPQPASGQVQVVRQAVVQESPAVKPPPAPDPAWQPTALPSNRRAANGETPHAAWYRMRFNLVQPPSEFWALLLPYFSGGGQVWLNGHIVGDIPVSTPSMHVRWQRPQLLLLPPGLLRAGGNDFCVRAMPVEGETGLNFPAPRVGPLSELSPLHDRRLFWVHTMPELTIGGCLVVSVLVLLIWWRLPEEVLYGWFGVATLMWAIRTLTFVIEVVPPERWQWWRLVYLASTGGFIVVMALFACRLAGLRSRRVEPCLLAYWAVGPAWFLLSGLGSDAQVNRLWTAGLIPIAIGAVVVSFLAVWRQRTLGSMVLPLALAVATLCGVHDYLVVWQPQALMPIAPGWVGERYFLLHHGANVLLVAMGALLAARFVRSVRSVRELNETLESRIADREKSLADNYARLAELERQNAASQERKLIMREIHDGLGSKLFTSLSRVERGAMDAPQMAASLRACISDMRLALDALAPDDHDLLIAFGDFMFRWQAELQALGMRCEWEVDVTGEALPLAPHATLKVLRIAQEALTNVAKHSRAERVVLSLRQADQWLLLSIHDDGAGLAAPILHIAPIASAGRGIRNMRARAEQLGGTLNIEQVEGKGTRVVLALPLGSL
jgi:signal transduction histidine kinase